jgi:plasmid stability protein
VRNMPTMIQIRNVPDEIHRKLKARAAAAGVSMSDYILKDITKLAERPTEEEWRKKLAELRPMKLTETPAQAIRAMRDSR